MISMLFTNTYVQATEKTGNLSVMEEETVTPIPDSNEEDVVPTETPTPGTEEVTPTQTPASGAEEVTATETPTPGTEEVTPTQAPTPGAEEVTPTQAPTPGTEEVTPTPTPVPAEKGAPQILTLEAADNISNLEKMSPAFSSDIYEYHFLDNGPEGRLRTMRATVDPDVLVTVNGEETEVNANGGCTLVIPYKGSGSKNDVTLTRKETGETTTYQFHTYFYGITNYSGQYTLVNSNKQEDTANISKLTVQGNSRVYDATTNLSKVRLRMSVRPGENKVFHADLTDKNNKTIDSFMLAGGEDGEPVIIDSKPLSLEKGDNIFYLKCYGIYKRWEDGHEAEVEGILTVTFRIHRNPVDDPETNANTALDGISLFINGVDGRDYIKDFSPDKKEYTVKLTNQEFDEALSNNHLWMKVKESDSGQQIRVYGGSTMHGVTTDDIKKNSNGCYLVADYTANDLYSEDSFTVEIRVTAPDKITSDIYRITVWRNGKSGMIVPDIYRNTSFMIVTSRPDRVMVLVLASVDIYDNGIRITGSQAISEGKLKIKIQNTDVISEEGKPTSGSGFPVRLNNPGTTPVQVTYDNGKSHYEAQISVSVYYSILSLKNEISIAQELLDSAKSGSRIYADGAEEALSLAISSARQVYNTYADAGKLSSKELQIITEAVKTLQSAEDTFNRSEVGKKITAFLPLDESVAVQNVKNGASISNVKQPGTLEAVIDGKTVTISGVVWTSRPTWQTSVDEETVYRFTPKLPAGYVVMEGVNYPVITVTRKAKTLPIEVKRTIPLDESVLVQHVPYGTLRSELNFPGYLEMYRDITAGDEGGRIQIPVRWEDLDGYDGNTPASYRFLSVINAPSDEFKLAQNTSQTPMQTITIIVDPPKDGGNTGGDDQENGNGNGNGDGSGNGNGSGSGSGNGNGKSSSGNSSKKGNGKNSGSGGSRDGSGNGMGQQEQKSSGDAGEASGEDTNKTTSDVEHNNDGGKSGGALKGSDIQKHAGAQEQQKDSDGTGKKSRWKVAEIVGDTVESHRGEFIFLGVMIALLLLYGGFREYRRHRNDDRKK